MLAKPDAIGMSRASGRGLTLLRCWAPKLRPLIGRVQAAVIDRRIIRRRTAMGALLPQHATHGPSGDVEGPADLPAARVRQCIKSRLAWWTRVLIVPTEQFSISAICG